MQYECIGCIVVMYTRKNAQVVTGLQTSYHKSVHKLSTSLQTSCNKSANKLSQVCSQAVNKLCSHCLFPVCCNKFETSC